MLAPPEEKQSGPQPEGNGGTGQPRCASATASPLRTQGAHGSIVPPSRVPRARGGNERHPTFEGTNLGGSVRRYTHPETVARSEEPARDTQSLPSGSGPASGRRGEEG